MMSEEPNSKEVAAFLRGAVTWKEAADGSMIDVIALMHGYANIAITTPFDMLFNVYSDVWQYQSVQAALAAHDAWDGVGEPTGWYRHPASGRRRPDGDPAKEFVRE